MSIAAAQASKFYVQVAAEGRLFTFTENGDYLVYSLPGKEVVPFWSSKSRLESIQSGHQKYQKYRIVEVSLEHFLSEDLPLFELEKVSVGVNWSGARLTGYDVSPSMLRENISYWQAKGRG